MYIRHKSILSVLICALLIFLSACTSNKTQAEIPLKVQDVASQTAISLPQDPRFNKLLDSNGKINTDLLVPVTVSKIQKNYDNRVFIEYNGLPFFYNPVYISYEQILNNKNIPENRKSVVLEEAFSLAKQNGFKTVALYVDWKNFYNGQSYNFDFYKIYFKLAEKYDLFISIIWNGYSKSGYMPWQTDNTLYPALSIDGAPLKVNVPDLSQEIYISEACEAITQFCSWLNYIDFGRRTVMIQLEDESNTNYGKGIWLSQFENYSNLLLKMAEAVKASNYNVVTTVGLTFDDYKTTIDEFTGRQRLDKFLFSEFIDGIGASALKFNELNVGMFANDNKFCYISKLSPAVNEFFKIGLNLLSQGYQFGVYELKSFDLNINCGMYRTHSTKWDLRNRQIVDKGLLAKTRSLEAATQDVLDFIKCINSIGEVLATTSLLDITVLNPSALNQYSHLYPIDSIALSFNNFSNQNFTYNSAGLCVIDPYSNIYAFAFHGVPFLAVDCDKEVSVISGKFIDGVWTENDDLTFLEDHYFYMESGLCYKIVLN